MYVDVIVISAWCRSLMTKGKQRMLPKKGQFGFFGWHLVKPLPIVTPTIGTEIEKDLLDRIIITEGEYDTLAVAQALDDYQCTEDSAAWIKTVPVVSLPNGCNSLPEELIALLERFQVIYLWLDNDSSGIAASEKFARKLGIHRCNIVRPLEGSPVQPKDANDALRSVYPNEDTNNSSENYTRNINMMVDMILKSKAIKHERIISFSDVKQEVKQNNRNIQSVLIILLGTGSILPKY